MTPSFFFCHVDIDWGIDFLQEFRHVACKILLFIQMEYFFTSPQRGGMVFAKNRSKFEKHDN